MPNRGDASGSDCSQSTRRGGIRVDGQLLHPLFDQYGGGEMYILGKHH